jgi:integrase
MDRWAWEQLGPWLQLRATLPVGALFCVMRGPTAGRPWAPAGVRSQLHHAAVRAGVRRRFAPHQLRHAHAVEMSREGVPLLVIQRQLGHADLAITSVYLRGIDNTEIVHAVHERPTPMIPATHGLYNLDSLSLVGRLRATHQAGTSPLRGFASASPSMAMSPEASPG